MAQTWIVGLLVGLAALYCLWYVLPGPARDRLGRIHRRLGRAPACGSCRDCGKCASPVSGPGSRAGQDQGQPITFHRKV
ncbi:hypothetical protein [Rhodoferax sp.]|uniref:hypothetical protein n=1 Tax=Rhodoferax sp. TaxID=50421 RepID=UPI002625E028|nr:hypothetical protein [Rhodoferax sp.]MDD2926421.1 hypothetical protein [Rhodoferax sp.]